MNRQDARGHNTGGQHLSSTSLSNDRNPKVALLPPEPTKCTAQRHNVMAIPIRINRLAPTKARLIVSPKSQRLPAAVITGTAS